MFEKKTMADYIYNEIKEAIVYLEYEPGEKLSEIQLAQKYNVSRSPVREALARLERDGLVVIKPQSGTMVSEISFKKAQDMHEIRYLLEPYATRIAVEKITNHELMELQISFDRLAAMESGTEERRLYITEVDVLLHDTILDCCGNKEIASIIKSFRPISERISVVNIQWRDRLIPVEKEMREIFENIKKKDPEGAFTAMQNHMKNSIIRTTKVISSGEK